MLILKIALSCLVITEIALRAQSVVPPTPEPNRGSEVATPTTNSTSTKTEERESPDKTYLKHTFGPAAVGRAAMGAGVDQATDTPSEWGTGAQGFGKRFASSFAKHIIKKGIQYPVAKLFHEELSYQRSDKTGFGPRLKYALTGVVTTHKTTDGSRTLAKGELAGAFGSGLISRAWQPASVRTVAAGFSSAGVTLGMDAAANVLKEFWPEIRHPHSHGKTAHLPENPQPVEASVAPDDEMIGNQSPN
jgi:hypothetical protein